VACAQREDHVKDCKFHVFAFANDYILELITSTTENPEMFVTKSGVHADNTRHRHCPHRSAANLSVFQKGVY
jgi:hypothetical protein